MLNRKFGQLFFLNFFIAAWNIVLMEVYCHHILTDSYYKRIKRVRCGLPVFFTLFLCLIKVALPSGDHGTPPGVVDTLTPMLQGVFHDTFLDSSQHTKQQELQKFYKRTSYRGAWLSGNSWVDAAYQVVDVLKMADEEGLWPEDYSQIEQIMKMPLTSPEALLKAEIEFSKVVLDYIDDLFGGRLHPGRISQELFLNPEPVEAAEILYNVLQSPSPGTSLKNLTVEHAQYQFLKKMLKTCRNKTSSSLTVLPFISSGKIIKRDETDSRLPIIIQRLKALGYLTTVHEKHSTFDIYLENAVKRFQIDHNLTADGKIGERTRRMLNKFNQDLIDQIIVSMERWRWLPRALKEKYIFVNIAGFELKAYDNGYKVLEMPVITGQNYRRTPVFTSIINAIRFNPAWHVPYSIAVKDKLPLLIKNPRTLLAKGYSIYDEKGEIIDPAVVRWASIHPRNFRYQIRQSPGDHNALGKIRFNVVNTFGIYLHSTPNKELFKKTMRNLSSGCIRVSQPAELAVFLLNNPQQWDLQQVLKAMEGTETRNVSLEQPVKIYISYFTLWAQEDGKIEIYDDIYDQDAMIYSALQKIRAK